MCGANKPFTKSLNLSVLFVLFVDGKIEINQKAVGRH